MRKLKVIRPEERDRLCTPAPLPELDALPEPGSVGDLLEAWRHRWDDERLNALLEQTDLRGKKLNASRARKLLLNALYRWMEMERR